MKTNIHKPKKGPCSCGHAASNHYISDVSVSKGKVFCSADNCTGWQHCNIDPKKVPYEGSTMRSYFPNAESAT